MSESDVINSENTLPCHVAIIMDGNGRWAQQQGKPRHAGHKAGVEATRNIIQECARKGIGALTLFAFSSENWKRPESEVNLLMELFLAALQRELNKLHKNNVRIRFIGDISSFPDKLQAKIAKSSDQTAGNTGLNLTIAAGYGGRWDIVESVRAIIDEVKAGKIDPNEITEESISAHICLSDLPEPDLFIRTGGEKRISNFLLWQLVYTELYFTDVLWPDFDVTAFDQALDAFSARQRRFGRTAEQVGVKLNNGSL